MALTYSVDHDEGAGQKTGPIRLLHVEDNLGYARIIQYRLGGNFPKGRFEFHVVPTLVEAEKLLDQQPFDIILADLGLADSKGLNTLHHLYAKAPQLPIVVMTGESDDSVVRELIKSGAQDYLDKSETNGDLIERVISFAIDRKRAEVEMLSLAQQDPLTQLVNRQLFLDRLQQSLLRATRSLDWVALIFVDLDKFKQVNDNYGHRCGDEMLKLIAQRLQSCIRESDTAARLGGDEFCVLAENLSSETDVQALAEAIRNSVEQPCVIEGVEFHPSASIGVTIHKGKRLQNATDVIHQADLAMYRAKRNGGNRCAYFTRDMAVMESVQAKLDSTFKQALTQQEFELYVQPRRHFSDGQLTAVEVLLYWQHPQQGLLKPDHFQQQLNASSEFSNCMRWLLLEACRQMRRWQLDRLIPASTLLSVPLSREFMLLPDMSAILQECLVAAEFPFRSLEIQLPEDVFLDDHPVVHQNLMLMTQLGLQLVMDNFGSSPVSLGALRCFPGQKLKLSADLVKGVAHDARELSVLKAVATLAADLDLTLLASAVDDHESQSQLMALGCVEGQGRLYAEPLSIKEFGNALHR